jgi:polyhydroxybutyrate depolymerase
MTDMLLHLMDGRARLELALVLGLFGCGAGPGSGDAGDPETQTHDVGGKWTADAGGPRSDAGARDADADADAGLNPGADSGLNPGVDSGTIVPTPDAGASDASSPDSGVVLPCSGKPGAHRGKVQASVNVGGAMRTFIYYAPQGLDANKAVPLIISPHGFTMSGEAMYTMTGFKELADREGLVAIFPDGNAGSPWNVGQNVSGLGIAVANSSSDDQGFVDAMIEYAKADQCIDTKHMFLSGFSMGGYFSNEVGCLRDDIAGVGPHSGGSHDLAQCKGSIKPVIIFHGIADWLIFYNDNAPITRDRWVQRNGCSAEFESRNVKGGACDYHKNCPKHAQVVLCHFDALGHAWAGGISGSFADPSMESASELAWKFWKEYAW